MKNIELEDIKKNLKDIKELMLNDVFVVDTHNNPEFSNSDMWNAINCAIKIVEDSDPFKKEVCEDYTLYELKENADLYIEECNFNNKKIVYFVHNNATAKSYPRGSYFKTLQSAKEYVLKMHNS